MEIWKKMWVGVFWTLCILSDTRLIHYAVGELISQNTSEKKCWSRWHWSTVVTDDAISTVRRFVSPIIMDHSTIMIVTIG